MNDPVLRIVRGQADDEECVAVLMALLMSASRRARLPAAAAAAGPPARAPWASGRQPGYTSPCSWRSP